MEIERQRDIRGIFAADSNKREKSSFVVIKVITRLSSADAVGESEQLKLSSYVPYVRPYTVAITSTNHVSHDC